MAQRELKKQLPKEVCVLFDHKTHVIPVQAYITRTTSRMEK